MSDAANRLREAPRPEDGEAFVEFLRRDFFLKKGDLYWRKRDASRFEAKFPKRAAAIFNARFGGKPAGKPADKRKGGSRFVRLGARDWPVETLVRIIETGKMPDEIAGDGMAYVDDIIIGSHPLGLALKAARSASGLALDDLTVLSQKYDPFRFDTPERHRDAAWFAELFARLVGPDETVHIRGFHYRLVAAGGVAKPDGLPYENNSADYTVLGDAAKRARWLGYVAFDRIVDQRNPDPIINRYRSDRLAPRVYVSSLGLPLARPAYIERPERAVIRDLKPNVWVHDFVRRQPYAFAFFGEKSSLEPVLRPLAQTYRADLFLAAGELSDTLVWRMARDAAADGRPLIVFCFSDFDPAGAQMPVSIARKLQALKVMSFPELRGQVVPVALTLEQAVSFALPTTPVKPGEKRARRWQEAYGSALYEAGLIGSPDRAAQVEIDALAALRPDDLRDIAEAAIRPYLDAGLDDRVGRVNVEWQRAAQAAVDATIDEDDYTDIADRAEELAEQYNEALDAAEAAQAEAQQGFADLRSELDEMNAGIVRPPPPELPEAEIDESAHNPLLDLDWGLVDGARALKARKAYEDTEEDGDAEGSAAPSS
jgi:hypothetical protein